jgi:two-component system, cell cycle response regulator DivK
MSHTSASPQPEAHRPETVAANPQLLAPAPSCSISKSTESKVDQSALSPKEPNLTADRRKKRRALISAPVRVRGIDLAAQGPNEISTTVDVSRNGILFVTSSPAFHRGMEVAVTFPYTKSRGVPQSEQPGSVVRVSALSHGRAAVAIAFGSGFGEYIADATCTRSDAVATPRADDSPESEESRKPLILAVESDGPVRDSLKAYLSGEGYKVIAVDNAADAREVLNMLTPALLIAEIEGEGLPGFDLCAHVKTTPRLQHIPVMLTTESAYPSDYSSAHSLGAIVCMAKPYRQERLGHVVRLLVAPAGANTNAEPPRAPDPSRRPKTGSAFRRDNPARLRFR